MPENEIPPAMRVDYYCEKKFQENFSAALFTLTKNGAIIYKDGKGLFAPARIFGGKIYYGMDKSVDEKPQGA